MGVPDRLSEGCERQQTGLLAGREVRVRKPTPTSNFPNFRALCGEPSPSMHDARGREQGAGSREQGAGGGRQRRRPHATPNLCRQIPRRSPTVDEYHAVPTTRQRDLAAGLGQGWLAGAGCM